MALIFLSLHKFKMERENEAEAIPLGETFCVCVKDFIYSFMRHTERDRDIGRGRSRLPVGSPMWDSVPGPGIMP